MTDYHKDRISIQVGLSGYSFKIETDDTVRSSEWLSADRIFTSSEFQRRYDEVEISVFTPKCALVPRQFHHPGESRQMYHMLMALEQIQDYNKIMASYKDGYLYLVIAQGRTLLLCNAFQAQDFTTAEYFIFHAMKKLQLNVEMSTIHFRTSLTEDEEISLYRYFKNVEQI